MLDMTLGQIQSMAYKISRGAGDLNAAEHGTLGKRIVRRQVTRRLGRSYGKLWRNV